MRSASWRLPPTRILFTSWVTSGELYTGSAITGWRGAGPLRGMSALLLLRAVTAAGLLAVADTLGVERTADDLVADAGQVLHPAATHEHDRVLLQVVADARDVGRDLDAGGEADTGHLAKCGVRLLRRRRVDARADTTTLRAALKRRRLGLADLVLPALADQLRDRGHSPYSYSSCGAVSPLFSSSRFGRPPRSGVSPCPRSAPGGSPPGIRGGGRRPALPIRHAVGCVGHERVGVPGSGPGTSGHTSRARIHRSKLGAAVRSGVPSFVRNSHCSTGSPGRIAAADR